MRTTTNYATMLDLQTSWGKGTDWDDLCEAFPILRSLADCPQDPRHHGEGDVATHTRMVIDELIGSLHWADMSEATRFSMFWTAVFHDVGKPPRTVHEPDGTITSRGHSKTGSLMARYALRLAGMPFEAREHACSVISAHQLPFWLYERADSDQIKKAVMLSMELDGRLLFAHASADAKGRICADPDDLAMRIELSRSIFEELDIMDRPYSFPNAESKLSYVNRDDRHLGYEAFENHVCTATVMCGLPGSGKDTWIAANMPGIPVVSLDDIREETGTKPTDNQGAVVQTALERAREHLRAGRDFVWNAVNINLEMRSRIYRLLRDYNARIRTVYIEVDPDTQREQNLGRKNAVDPSVVDRLARKLEPPRDWEAHDIVRIVPKVSADMMPQKEQRWLTKATPP